MNYLFLGLSLMLVGCSSIQKMATRTTTPVFRGAGEKITREPSWEFYKNSNPGNLKFMEMVYFSDISNRELLALLVKGYAGYAYGVLETLHMNEELSGKESAKWKHEAIIAYTKALDYGLDYLEEKKISRSDLLNLDEVTISKRFSSNLTKEDHVTLLYFAQVWGSLINLQKDNIALVSQIPKVKTIFDWVCGQDEKIEDGVCDIFYAQYEASRPKMLGGNPEKAEELYQRAMQRYPKHLLIRLSYIQFMILPGFDQVKYEKEATLLKEEFAKFDDFNRDNLENKSEYMPFEELNLFNAIAKKRFEIIEKYKAKIF